MFHHRTEIRYDQAQGKWREIEIWTDAALPPFGAVRTEERPGKWLRPLAPGETVEALREAGKTAVMADANTWVTEE